MRCALEIKLLGDLTVLRDGTACTLPQSKKARALLGYLVATGRPHSRERLCDLLWDGPDDPRGGLRWALSRLRAAVDDPSVRRLAATRAEVGFEARGAAVDLCTVHHLVAGGVSTTSLEALCQAAACFRGEFLDGLDLTGCFRFHEWCIGEREANRMLRVRILDALVACLQVTAPEEALTHARERVRCDPLSEQAHASVMELLGRLGRQREALEQYDACRRILETALGVRPQGPLEQARAGLVRAVLPRRAAPPPDPVPPAAPAGLCPAAPPLVGRQAELAELERAASATDRKGRQVLLLVAEAGLGKTRLLQELAVRVSAAGGLVLMGRAFEAEMVRPFGAWIEALGAPAVVEAAAPWRDALAPLLPALGLGRPGHRDLLFQAVAKLLGALARDRPLAVLLDDLHWIDEASAALVHAVARQAIGQVLLAGAVRPGEMADNPAALRLQRALARSGCLREIELQPLNGPETTTLVGGIDPSLDAQRIFAESRGNPLFAMEMAQALRRGDARSATLDDLIADRLERLEGRPRELVGWAAAFGGTFGSDLLVRASGLPAADVLAALGDLEARGVVRTAPGEGSGHDFAHDLVRRVAYHRLSGPRRQLIHLQIARALAVTPDPDGARAGDLAHHAALGGDPALAVRACLAAGQRAVRLFAFAEASELAERGIRLATRLPVDERIPVELDLLALHVQPGLAGERAHQVEARISRLVLEAQSAGLADVVARGFWFLSVAHHGEGDDARAHEVSLQAAEAARASGSLAAAEALAGAGRCLVQLEREIGRAERLLREAEAIAARDQLPVIDVELGLGFLHAFDGRPTDAAAHLTAGLSMLRRAPDHWREFEVQSRLTTLALEARRFEETRVLGRELSRVAAKLNEGSEAPFAAGLEALAAAGLGEPDAAAALARAEGRLRAVDSSARLAYLLLGEATLALDRGRTDEARRPAEEALAAATRVGRVGLLVAAHALLARIDHAGGNRAGAAAHLEWARAAVEDPRDVGGLARHHLAEADAAIGRTAHPATERSRA